MICDLIFVKDKIKQQKKIAPAIWVQIQIQTTQITEVTTTADPS